MSAATAPGASLPVRPVSLAIVAVATALVGYLSGFPDGLGLFLAVGAVVFAAGLRTIPTRRVYSASPVPVLAVLVLEAATAPVGLGSELLAGFAGLAFLVWVADDPSRPKGGALRALPEVALPALALGIAWTSALFLPYGVVPIGVAGALLALTVAAVAFLVGWPALFDREEARS